jgi:hypothetical protein
MKLGKPLPPVTEVKPPTQEEIDNLVRKWDDYCPQKYKGLLAAKALGSEEKSNFYWDVKNKRYSDKTGRILSGKEIRQAYLEYLKAIK